MSETPDVAGFAEAQKRLRNKLGRSVTFFTPLAPVYSPSTASGSFDPETHLPYDPVIQPIGYLGASGVVASAYASASARCSVVFQPLTAVRREPSQANALGVRDKSNKDLIADPSDLPAFEHATWFELDGEAWRIELTKNDGIGAFQRVIIYGEELK